MSKAISKAQVWLEATRPKTLPAALCPVLVGTSLAFHQGVFDGRAALICLAFAFLVQVGTNYANDYLDGIKGADSDKRLGPRRAVASGQIAPATMKRAAVLVLVLAFCLGLLLIPFGGWWLLIVGVASVLCAWLYTGGPYPLAYNGLGDVFVVLFFGFIAVGCTFYVQAGTVQAEVLWSGFACGLLINNILVVNNYRDVEEDRISRKKTLAVCFGRSFAQWQYRISVFLVAAVTVYLAFQLEEYLLLMAILPLLPEWQLGGRLPKLRTPREYLAALKTSGLVVAAYGVLFAGALFL